jgi:hypothetical protein
MDEIYASKPLDATDVDLLGGWATKAPKRIAAVW